MRKTANAKEKIALLELIRMNPEGFLPMPDHAWKEFPETDRGTEEYDDPQHNLGWDAGLLEGKRPYFMECWASCGITMLTHFISVKGIETAAKEDVTKLLTDAGLFRFYDPEHPRVNVMTFTDGSGNDFFSVNVTVGDEEDTYLEGGRMYSFKTLNAYNRKRNKEAENHG